ncbi:hypothetical protein OJF2_42950 [Aquisphaera giovannonii]|uniref:DUF3301 domain-containing protein n=1 Tax=Aquisphaera giovannonii TaxID=406548 RepID=A0A5B9W592_9BACT|nr:hypothetical protein [Aquisphaera giovannonii]QEH35738.1 hypothetical protein OJF2_42950 [Aquisphaera giovannonii]
MDAFAAAVLIVFGFLAAAVVVINVTSWQSRRLRGILEAWADRNGFELLDADRRYDSRGPFTWDLSGQGYVYRVKVRSKEGVRTGWLRCGGPFPAILSDRVEVRWDEPPTASKTTTTRPADAMADPWLDR